MRYCYRLRDLLITSTCNTVTLITTTRTDETGSGPARSSGAVQDEATRLAIEDDLKKYLKRVLKVAEAV